MDLHLQFLKNHPVIVSVVVIFALVVIFAISLGSDKTSLPADAVGTVVSPVEGAASAVTGGIGEWFKSLFGRSQLQQENAALRERISQLEGQIALNGELQQENDRLREIANFYEENPEYEMLTARVTARNPGYWFDTFLINAGRGEGIQKDMVVLTPQGLVGRIIEVGSNWSKVQAVIDSLSSVSGMIERTRDVGVVRGTAETGAQTGGRCNMYYLPYENDLVPGDRVLTSGLGGLFPKGVVIGEVIEVSRAAGETERTAVVQTAVDFSQLEEVIVLLEVIEEIAP